jgi:hypothetical protein
MTESEADRLLRQARERLAADPTERAAEQQAAARAQAAITRELNRKDQP